MQKVEYESGGRCNSFQEKWPTRRPKGDAIKKGKTILIWSDVKKCRKKRPARRPKGDAPK